MVCDQLPMGHGEDTQLDTTLHDDPVILLECAQMVGLDMDQVERVLAGQLAPKEEVLGQVDQVHAARSLHVAGYHSTPQLVFEEL